MSSATLQVTVGVDEDVKLECPSDRIFLTLHSHTCTQSNVTPQDPAAPGTDQILSTVTYSGCPFNSCCYKDSDIKWDLHYEDEKGDVVKIAMIKFHEPWSTSWHSSGVTYYDSTNGGVEDNKYDVSIKTVSDVDRSTKCECTVRPKP